MDKIKHFLQRELIMIRCNQTNFHYFFINSDAKRYFEQPQLTFYVELDVYKADQTINWLTFASVFTGHVHVRLTNVAKIGEFQQIKISHALSTIANLRTLHLKTEDSLVTDGSFFTLLANSIATFPALHSLAIDASSNNIGIRAKQNE